METRKRQLKVSGKISWHFYSLLTTPFHVWQWQPMFPVWDPCFWRDQKDLIHKLVSVCSNLSGTTGRSDARCSTLFHLTQNSGQKNSWCCSKRLQGKLTTHRCLGQKIILRTYNRLSKAWEEKLGESLWEITLCKSTHKKECNLTICNSMDGPRGYYVKWNKSKTNAKWFHLYVESKEQNKWINKLEIDS